MLKYDAVHRIIDAVDLILELKVLEILDAIFSERYIRNREDHVILFNIYY